MTLVFGRDATCHYCKHVHGFHRDPYAPCSCCGTGSPRQEGELAKNRGIQLVIAKESTDWPARAERWVLGLPRGERFTAETLCAAIGRPERMNSVGARFNAMAKLGWIRPVDYQRAKRKARHASRMLEWVRT